MTPLFQLLDTLITRALEHTLITPDDVIYCRNMLLSIWEVSDYTATDTLLPLSITDTLDALTDLAATSSKIEDTLSHKDRFASRMMNVFLDKPSVINERFNAYYTRSPEEATSYFYDLSKFSNYIKTSRIAQNQSFTHDSPYGPITLTINLSKPEKDPKQIAAEKNMPPVQYPSCLLCIENEGFEGSMTLPDRSNHRMIRLHIN
ncbi:MAG: UDP-glucose--hexose-1-phosphate uridylyltransferase, partial [Cellulosilyticaceae bacterium]